MTTSTQTRRSALDRAAREHDAYLRRRLLALGVPPRRIDDATQDVLEVLARRIDDYDERYSFRQWMTGVARRVARRHRERAGREPVSLGAREPRAVAEGSAEGDPEEVARLREARAVLDAFLDSLDRERWAVFVRAEIDGLRGTEIAAELGLNLNTVYARLRSARRAFDRALRRHRARAQRPGLLGVLALPRAPARGGAVALVVVMIALVALAAALAVGGVGNMFFQAGNTRADERSAAPPERVRRARGEATQALRAAADLALSGPAPAAEPETSAPAVASGAPSVLERPANAQQLAAIERVAALYDRWDDESFSALFETEGPPWVLQEKLEWFRAQVGECGTPRTLVVPTPTRARFVFPCERGEFEAAITLVDEQTPRITRMLSGVRGVDPPADVLQAAEAALALYERFDEARFRQLFADRFELEDMREFFTATRAGWGPCELEDLDLASHRGALFDLSCEIGPRLMKVELDDDDRIRGFLLKGRRRGEVREG